MNILLIEDNQQFAENLSYTLLKNTYVNRVERLVSFAEFEKMKGHLRSFDIVLVDLVLKGDTMRNPSGFKIIDSMRKNGNTLPIVVISSSDTIDDIEYAFSLGATDYMGKDIRHRELEVRLFHWYKEYCMSTAAKKRGTLSYHGLEFSQTKNEYLYRGKIINFTKMMKYIFSLFFHGREELIPDDYIIEKVWGYNDELSMKNTLRVNIKRLRSILEEYEIAHWLRTDWGEGYIFGYIKPEITMDGEEKKKED